MGPRPEKPKMGLTFSFSGPRPIPRTMNKRLLAGAFWAGLLMSAPCPQLHAATRQARAHGRGPRSTPKAFTPVPAPHSPSIDVSQGAAKPAAGIAPPQQPGRIAVLGRDSPAQEQAAQASLPNAPAEILGEPAAAADIRGRLSIDKASELIEHLRKALRQNGVERFDIVGGSALSLLEAVDKGEITFRDFDIVVVAHGVADEALTTTLSRAVASQLGADFDPASVKQRLRERRSAGKAQRYNAGHGSFIESNYGQIDLSVFHGPKDLARQGLLSWERIRIPVDAKFELRAFLSALHQEGYERLRAAGRVKDPDAGWSDLKAGRIRLVKRRILALAPHLYTLRLLNELDKRGLAMPRTLERMLTKLFPARAPPEPGWIVHNLDRTTRKAGAAAILKTLAKIGFFAGWADPLAGFLNEASVAAVIQVLARAPSQPRFEMLAALLKASTPDAQRSWLTQGILDFDPRLYRELLGLTPGPLRLIASIGPASSDASTLGRLVRAGAAWLRVNLAHNDVEDTASLIRNLRQAVDGAPIPLLFDLPGGKIRTGPPPLGGSALLRDGERFTLRYGLPERPSTEQEATLDYANLSSHARVGGRVLLHQGKIELLVTDVSAGRIETKVVRGGTLRGRATVDLLGADPAFPKLREEDRRKIRIAVENGADYIGVSMLQRPDQMDAVREELRRLSAAHVKLVSKIETLSALENLEAIVERSDLVMIAGGDLATAVGSEQALRLAQLKIADAAARHGKDLIVATGYEGADAPAKIQHARDLGAGFILLKNTAIDPDPIGIVDRLEAIIRQAMASSR